MSEQVVAYLARHGETLWNEEDLLKGGVDEALDANGRREARELAKFLLGIKHGRVYTSPVQRAWETAMIYALLKGIPQDNEHVIQERRLHSWHTGVMEGIKRGENKQAIKLFVDHPDVKIPDGESLNHLRDRVEQFLREEIKEVLEDGQIPCLSFTHNSVIRAACYTIAGGDDEHEIIKPGGVVAIIKSRAGYDMEVMFESNHSSVAS